MSARKPWPHEAAWTRDNSAEGINNALRLLRPLLDHEDPVVIARAGKAIYLLQNAIRALEAAGAKTTPDEPEPR